MFSNKGVDMKHVLQGIGDYVKDCWHDFLFEHLQRFYDTQLRCLCKECEMNVNLFSWKEGSVWHYIRQRKIENCRKKQKDE